MALVCGNVDEVTRPQHARLGLAFEVPVFVIQGTEDDYTPAALSRAFVDALTAPRKEFVALEGAGHMAIVSRPSEFLNAMKARVRRD